MRIRLPLGRTLFLAAAFLFALVALLPLRLALGWLGLGERGLAAREARGSLWYGALSEARLGPVALGDVTAGLRTLPLFAGRARIDLRRDAEPDAFQGSFTISRHAFGVDDVTGSLSLGSAFAALPPATFDLSEAGARFADGQCASAEGLVKVRFTAELAGLLQGGSLSGTPRCDGGALLLPLASPTGTESLDVRMFGDGRYTVTLVARPGDDAARDRLTGAGFTLTPRGYALTAEGRF